MWCIARRILIATPLLFVLYLKVVMKLRKINIYLFNSSLVRIGVPTTTVGSFPSPTLATLSSTVRTFIVFPNLLSSSTVYYTSISTITSHFLTTISTAVFKSSASTPTCKILSLFKVLSLGTKTSQPFTKFLALQQPLQIHSSYE